MYWLIHEALGGVGGGGGDELINQTDLYDDIDGYFKVTTIFHVGFCNIIDVLLGNV